MKQYIKRIIQKYFLYFYAVLLPDNYNDYVKSQAAKTHRLKWRKLNPHNFTNIGNEPTELPFPIDKVFVGSYTYGSIKAFSFGSLDEKLIIGSFCSIAPNVKFILGGMHHFNHLSTFPFKAYFYDENESFSKGPIIVEDDVWIGADAIILSGVTISRGTVVAAGSVVVKSTLPYSIIGGNPARLIKYRFNETEIMKLASLDFDKIDENFIRDNIELLYKIIDDETIEELYSKKSIRC